MENSVNQKPAIFTKNQLIKLIIPLIIEQLLAVTVGMADTLMISRVGQNAVSGISVVDSINILIIQVFAALATGGAVVSAQFLGAKDHKKACRSANQLVTICLAISLVFALVSVIWNPYIITGIFGYLEKDVFEYARTYYYITALSFPFLAVYNACAAICRSMGNSKLSMRVALLMNGLNIVGNAFLIFVLNMEVAGAAISTLIARIIACIIIFVLVLNPKAEIHIVNKIAAWKLDFHIIKRILFIGIPVAIENGLFQGGKLIIAGLVSTFGTGAIAANAVGNNIASIEAMPGMAIGLALITVAGQSLGAKRYDEAIKYTKNLCIITYICHIIVALPILIFLNQIISIYNLPAETSRMAYQICLLHGILCCILWPPSFTLPNAFRAAEDVKYVMTVAMISMVFCRIVLSYVFGIYFHMGLFGVWLAMMCDWLVRDTFFIPRFFSGKWLKIHKLSTAEKVSDIV